MDDCYEAGRQAARLHLQAKDHTTVDLAKQRAAAHDAAGRSDAAAYWHGYALEVSLSDRKVPEPESAIDLLRKIEAKRDRFPVGE